MMDPIVYFLYRWTLGIEAEAVLDKNGNVILSNQRGRKLKNAVERSGAVWGTDKDGNVISTDEVNKFLMKYLT